MDRVEIVSEAARHERFCAVLLEQVRESIGVLTMAVCPPNQTARPNPLGTKPFGTKPGPERQARRLALTNSQNNELRTKNATCSSVLPISLQEDVLKKKIGDPTT